MQITDKIPYQTFIIAVNVIVEIDLLYRPETLCTLRTKSSDAELQQAVPVIVVSVVCEVNLLDHFIIYNCLILVIHNVIFTARQGAI